MPSPTRAWLLVLLTFLSSNVKFAVSQGCTSLVRNGNVEFSASSSVLGPGTPVVDGMDVWCAGISASNQHLEVNLGFNLLFDKIFVQGKANSNRSVSEYFIYTSADGDIYTPIRKAGMEVSRSFYGPWFNGDAVRAENLASPVQAQYVRFNPREPLSNVENYLCMRIDIQSCQNVPAPVHGEWTDWSNWSPCPPCGDAVRSRSRTCTDPAPAFGGNSCKGASGMNQLCPNNCPVIVDGNWSNWGAWSLCSETCGNGTATRSRACDNPRPENGGKDCVGPAIDSKHCFVQHCPVNGSWSGWSVWGPCSTTCGNGIQTRTRACDNPAPAHGGADCDGQPSESQVCVGQPCPVPATTLPPTTPTTPTPPVTTPVPIVDGGWTNWTYSACDAQCGPGKQNRSRTCTNPPPSGGGAACVGNAFEMVDCNEGPCVDPNMPDIDLAFALSATSANSNESYALMRNTIKQLIDKYGVDKIHYSVIVYGASVIRVVNFNNAFPPSASDLKAAIDAQPPLSGPPVLENLLQEAVRVFNETEVRPNAKKVLVVMADENSGADPNSLSAAVKPVEDIGVLVLSVAVGSGVDRNELSVISPNPKDVISAGLNGNPAVVAEHIMDRILRRNIPEIDVGFAIRFNEVDSAAIFTVMTETRDTINHRYGSGQVKYTVIIYGKNFTTTSLDFGVNDQLSLSGLIEAANQTLDSDGPVDLQAALVDAERLFRSHGRPNAKKVFIALTDTAKSENDSEIIIAGDALRRQGILVFSVNNTGGLNAVTITQVDFLDVPTFTTVRSVVIAETIIKKALEVNMPLIDLTFAISATALQSDTTFRLMQTTINNIVAEYDIFRIHYSVIVFGAVATTHIDFSSNIPDKDTLILRVSRLSKKPGDPDLVQALEHAKQVYESQNVRPEARRFLVVIMDNNPINNATDLNRAVTDLDNKDVVIIGVGVGNSVNRTYFEIITKDPRHIITVRVNKSPDELADEIIDAIFISIRTAGFSQWAEWTACTKSCRSGGVAGTQRRTRVCVKSRLGCIGATAETRECNTQECLGCEERGPFSDNAYLASSTVQPGQASWARLNTSNPGANVRAWCGDPDNIASGGYVQIDLGENVDIFRLATKGQERVGSERWVTSYFISHSTDGLSFTIFQEGGQRKDFQGNTDPKNVTFNDVNITTPVRYIRFHPISFSEQPCMQASVFGCTSPTGPNEGQLIGDTPAEIGILIALWILAGILSFLLLMACCYYCCWHVCCGRGKKKKGLTAFRHTWIDDTDGYLVDDLDKRWRLPSVDLVARAPEDEIQEVAVEMGSENPKPSGIIQFGIEAEETRDNQVTADTVHSETPQYSEEIVGAVKKGASMIAMSSSDTGYRSTERRQRIKSETAASVLAAGDTAGDPRYVNQRRRSSGFSNGGFIRSQEWLIDPSEMPKAHNRASKFQRSQSADEMAAIDLDMFEQSPGSADNAVRGELGKDGYMRMKQTSRERLDVAGGVYPMGTGDIAVGGIDPPDAHIYDIAGQELTFETNNGVCRREQWSAVGEDGLGVLTEEGFREVQVETESPYAEISFDDKGNILGFKN